MRSHTPPHSPADGRTDAAQFSAAFEQACQLLDSGKTEAALAAFEHARALDPSQLQGIYACATLLAVLKQPQASYELLLRSKSLLWNDPDGVANLAVAAETLGHDDEAEEIYAHALTLQSQHVRSLNNLALRRAAAGRWDDAVAMLQQCVLQEPGDAQIHLNLIDFLNGAWRDDEALQQAQRSAGAFPSHPDIGLRHAVTLAFNGQLAQAQVIWSSLGPQANAYLRQFLQQSMARLPKQLQKNVDQLPGMDDFFAVRAFAGMQVANWQRNAALTDLLKRQLARTQERQEVKDWRDTQYHALLLDMTEEQQTALRIITGVSIDRSQHAAAGYGRFRPKTGNHHGRFRIGLCTQNLGDPRHLQALVRQLQLHDQDRFEFHLYSPTPVQGSDTAAELQDLGAHVLDIDHLSDSEAAGRLRLDRLDIWMDLCFYTAWCRPELPAIRVAPVQLRHQTWQRQNPPQPCDYATGDHFTHPGDADDPGFGAQFGHIARFPHTCWLSTDLPTPGEVPGAAASRSPLLCAQVHALHIDPFSFGLWMQIMRRVPEAELSLPAYLGASQGNLRREAAAAGIDPARIVFEGKGRREDYAMRLRHALYLDSLRINANQPLVDALASGVPAITVAGHNMASRLGGSILAAAGLADCIKDSPESYVQAAVQLCAEPAAMSALRRRLTLGQQPGAFQAPLFNPQARVREWEWAWAHMIERDRAGLPPQAFDIPSLG